jgi:glycerol-3-phosphate dehydrogenase (NAD(P)+)
LEAVKIHKRQELMQKNTTQAKIAVIGGGSWATALVKILSENNVKMSWWLRSKEDVDHIRMHQNNPNYLSDIQINLKKVKPTTDLKKAVEDSTIILLVVPAAFIKEVLLTLSPPDFKDKIIISAIKGMIPEENILVTEYVAENFRVSPQNIGVIAGPCHSEEIAMEKRSYLTIAGNDLKNAQEIAGLLNCRYVKTSVIKDLSGVEYAAIMKNIIAIACGIARGLNYGDNFQSVLVSNSMHEIKRLLSEMHPLKERDLNASAYLGDLLVTCYSQFSRNRTLGNMVGRGYSVKSAQVEMNMIAEGYYAVKCIHEINKTRNIDMPITRAVYNILYERISPAVEMRILENSMS